jgi:hypothetical protein
MFTIKHARTVFNKTPNACFLGTNSVTTSNLHLVHRDIYFYADEMVPSSGYIQTYICHFCSVQILKCECLTSPYFMTTVNTVNQSVSQSVISVVTLPLVHKVTVLILVTICGSTLAASIKCTSSSIVTQNFKFFMEVPMLYNKAL